MRPCDGECFTTVPLCSYLFHAHATAYSMFHHSLMKFHRCKICARFQIRAILYAKWHGASALPRRKITDRRVQFWREDIIQKASVDWRSGHATNGH